MYRENPFFVQLLSFVLAIGLHAVILFGHFSLQPTGIDMGSGTVELAPPAHPATAAGNYPNRPPPPPPPPPPGESLPEPPAEEAMAEEPKPDDIPEPDAEAKDEKKEERPRISVQYESPVYSTNKMSAEEAERAIRFLLEHGRPGAGQVGSKPGGGGGGGGGKSFGGQRCIKCPQPEYPYEARKMHQEGTVVFRTLIGTDGKIQSIVIHQSSGHTLLDQSAFRSVRKYEIEPRKVAGIPVTTQLDIPIVYQMERVTESPPPPTPPDGDATGPAPPPQ